MTYIWIGKIGGKFVGRHCHDGKNHELRRRKRRRRSSNMKVTFGVLSSTDKKRNF